MNSEEINFVSIGRGLLHILTDLKHGFIDCRPSSAILVAGYGCHLKIVRSFLKK